MSTKALDSWLTECGYDSVEDWARDSDYRYEEVSGEWEYMPDLPDGSWSSVSVDIVEQATEAMFADMEGKQPSLTHLALLREDFGLMVWARQKPYPKGRP